MLQDKKILVGICGSIAAYKSAYLVRELIKKGAEVRVIMTSSALDFISPLTLATLSKNPVESEFVKNEQGEWTNHVDLGLWADLMIVAPASANTLAKFANGLCDNLLTAVYLSARCPVMIAPAMDLDMYQHPSTKANLNKLTTFDNIIVDAEHGELASGLVGKGRMAEPESLVAEIEGYFKKKSRFKNINVLITAGPTYEHLDPVRFIGNHSTGKMGYSLAEVLAGEGAIVTIVSGPVQVKASNPNIKVIDVSSADQMLEASLEMFKTADIAIFAAAVADYKPRDIADQKIKKNDPEMTVTMVKNKDIAYELGAIKTKQQFTVGFALETQNEEENARKKLKKKNFDMIVLNSLNDKGAGFKHNTNKIAIIENNNIRKFELKSKKEVAHDIVDSIASKLLS